MNISDIPIYEQCKELEKENAELKAELKKYKDMAAKGLEEFKDVGGCWGCGLQLQLKQNLEDIKHLKAENDRLKRENRHYKAELKLSCNELDKSGKWQVFERQKKIKYYQILQEIKKIAERELSLTEKDDELYDVFSEILQKIIKSESEG